MNHTTRSSSSWLLSQSQEEQQQRRSILLRRLLEETVREEVGMQPSYHMRTHQTTYRYQNPNYNAMLQQQQQRMSEQLSLPRPTTPRATTVITPSQAYHCPSYSPNCTADDNATGEAESILENLAPHAIAPRGGGGTRSSNSLACNSHSNRQNIQGNLSLGVFDGVPANWFLPSRPTSDSTASSANTFQTVVTVSMESRERKGKRRCVLTYAMLS
jgi:hypothetical protein